MTLDKEDHRAILLQLVMKNAFPGEFSETVTELKLALQTATIKVESKPEEKKNDLQSR